MTLDCTWNTSVLYRINRKQNNIFYNTGTRMQFTYLQTIDKAYAGIAIVMASLSILSGIIIITVLATCSSLRTNGRKLLICLTVANLISCVASIVAAGVSVFTPDLSFSSFPVCAAASAISIVSNVCAYLWTCAISLYVYLCISWKKIALADRLRCVFHVVCWGFPGRQYIIIRFNFHFQSYNNKLVIRPLLAALALLTKSLQLQTWIFLVPWRPWTYSL